MDKSNSFYQSRTVSVIRSLIDIPQTEAMRLNYNRFWALCLRSCYWFISSSGIQRHLHSTDSLQIRPRPDISLEIRYLKFAFIFTWLLSGWIYQRWLHLLKNSLKHTRWQTIVWSHVKNCNPFFPESALNQLSTVNTRINSYNANEFFKWKKRNVLCGIRFYQQSPRFFCINWSAQTILRDMEPGHQHVYRWPFTIWLTIHDKVWPIFVKDSSVVVDFKVCVGVESSLFRIVKEITTPREIKYAPIRTLAAGNPTGHQIPRETCAEKRLNTLRSGQNDPYFPFDISNAQMHTQLLVFIQNAIEFSSYSSS